MQIQCYQELVNDMNVMWFRSDLRTYDNPALYHAVQSGPTIAVYFVAQDQWRQHHVAEIKQNLILRQLLDLKWQLEQINVPLLVLDATDFSNIPKLLIDVCKKHMAGQVFFNHEYEWNENQLTQVVSAQLISRGIEINGYHDQCMITPGAIRNQQGNFYKVFTAFKKAYLAQLVEKIRPLYAKPPKQTKVNIKANISCVLSILKSNHDKHAQWQHDWPAGEGHSFSLLDAFIDDDILRYHECRDIPSMSATSKLSAYLAIGAISVRQCFQGAMGVAGAMDNKGVNTWVIELIWRDFYRHLIYAFPEVCRFKPFKPNTDQLPWKQQGPLFKAWCEGRTGFPIVDAAMKQLLQTGWMHNRLRMVTAMFLTKHLFVDWRLGEQFFMEHLVDGDFASNNGGWQWSASTGVDAVPYFRIFNPTRQSQRFDTNGEFIRRYLPELSALDNKSIHQPSKQQVIQCGYVMPIVDHAQAVTQTKTYFKQLSEAPMNQKFFKEYALS